MAARNRKLILHQKVEVRSVEDGFFGSWHPGKVIGCKELGRVVEYDHLVCVDGSTKLVEEVKVAPAIDGVFDEKIKRPGEYRGLIRPCPETQTLGLVGARTLQYGACVDLFHHDAWWEGDDLRFSKDWDEVTEKWRSRGNWLFLELLEEYEQEYPRLVSVKQIWYEVRTKDNFKNLGEWTSSKRDVWKQLLPQVLSDNIKLLAKITLRTSAAPFEDLQSNDKGIPQTDVYHGSNNQVQIEDDQVCVSVSPTDEQVWPPDPDAESGIGSSSYDESHSLKSRQGRGKSPTKTRRLNWQSAVPQLIPGPQQCPDAIDSYKEHLAGKGTARKGTAPNGLSSDVSKHLLYLGWKIEFRRTCMGNSNRKCYISPNGKTFHSLPEVFKKFHGDFELEPTSHVTMRPNYDIANYMSSYEETPSPPGKSQAFRNLFKSPCITVEKFEIESKYCPKAVRDYCSLASKSAEGKLKGMEARKHLSALGWSFYRHNKGPYGWEIRYMSPTGKMFYSLLSACRWCVKAGALTSTDPSRAMGRVVNRDFINNYDGSLSTSKSHLPRIKCVLKRRELECEAHKTRMSRKKRRKVESNCLEVSLASPKRGWKSNASMRLREDLNADSLTPVRQSSKRVQQKFTTAVAKMVPELQKDEYLAKGSNVVAAGEFLLFSNFEAHVGSSDRKPSANIYLEDGMSLLECQLHLKLRYSGRNSRRFQMVIGSARPAVITLNASQMKEIHNVVLKVICSAKIHVDRYLMNVATYDDESSVENYCKLNVALSVMHECFEPVKEPRTRRVLMEDIIFNRRSDLNRLNFQGFYAVLLEKNDELISAASVRIYGKTVAEVPLVATRFQYRRLGMCRILMNELEKQLAELGVKRLVLPAVPSTIFCQKMLKSDLPAENQTTGCDHVDNNAGIWVGGISHVSDVLEGKQVEETDIMEQESACNKTVADNGDAGCPSAEKAIAVVNQPTALELLVSPTRPWLSSTSHEQWQTIWKHQGHLKILQTKEDICFLRVVLFLLTYQTFL
ncbi:hypothetical protein SASPL_135800 [Salvia splendens]|uniref:N-acetyltransferase domain-containing protein n=1 Tax=Salvia splendens TaxID=180675 RepID=A0A8X8WX47_SALSN|nr:hypothetical protein SASPL_135800 [Salvia splendens]